VALTHIARLAAAAPDFVREMRQHQRRNFALFLLDGAMFALAISLLAETTIIPTFVTTIENNPLLVGAVGATFALGNSLPQIVGAHLLQGRRRRKPLLLAFAGAERAGILGIAVSAQLVGVVPDTVVLVSFFIAFGLYAATTGLLGPVYGDVLAKTFPDWRGYFYGSVQLIGGTLGFGAALAAERIIRVLPVPSGFQTLFWMSLAFSLASLAFLSATRDFELAPDEPREPLLASVRRIPQVVAADVPYRRFLLARAVVATSGFAIGFVVFDAVQRGVTIERVALLTAILIAAQASFGFGFGILGARLGWRPVLISAGVLVVLAMAGAVFAVGDVAYGLVFAAVGGFRAGAAVVDPNMSIEFAPLGQTARYLAITATVLAPFLVLGPIVAGALVPVVGSAPIFIAAAALALAGLLLALRVKEPR
jgi:MFS family permease